MRKCIFKTDPSVSIQLSLRPSTWTKCSAGNSAQAGRCAVNKSHLIDVLTPLLRQRSAASRNNRPLFPHRLPMCTKALMVTWIELTVTVQRALLIQHLSSEWFRVNEKKKKKKKPSSFSSFLFRTFSSCLSEEDVCLSPNAAEHKRVLSLLMLGDRSHLLSTPAAHRLSPTIWWRAKMVICYSLLRNHCAVKSAFCLPRPGKQLQPACISVVIALHISWQCFIDGEIEKQIFHSHWKEPEDLLNQPRPNFPGHAPSNRSSKLAVHVAV